MILKSEQVLFVLLGVLGLSREEVVDLTRFTQKCRREHAHKKECIKDHRRAEKTTGREKKRLFLERIQYYKSVDRAERHGNQLIMICKFK